MSSVAVSSREHVRQVVIEKVAEVWEVDPARISEDSNAAQDFRLGPEGLIAAIVVLEAEFNVDIDNSTARDLHPVKCWIDQICERLPQ